MKSSGDFPTDIVKPPFLLALWPRIHFFRTLTSQPSAPRQPWRRICPNFPDHVTSVRFAAKKLLECSSRLISVSLDRSFIPVSDIGYYAPLKENTNRFVKR